MKKKLSLIFLILSIASLAGTIITTVMYFINKGKVNSVEFIRIASNSIKEAKELMDKTSMLLNIALSRLDSQIKYAVESIEQMKKDVADIQLDVVTIRNEINEIKEIKGNE